MTSVPIFQGDLDKIMPFLGNLLPVLDYFLPKPKMKWKTPPFLKFQGKHECWRSLRVMLDGCLTAGGMEGPRASTSQPLGSQGAGRAPTRVWRKTEGSWPYDLLPGPLLEHSGISVACRHSAIQFAMKVEGRCSTRNPLHGRDHSQR